MLKKLIRQMLIAQTFSALTVSLCLLIDSIVIGRFLGVGAMAAYGLANPILLVIGAVAMTLSAGVQVVCGRALGQGRQEETAEGFSSAIGLVLMISVPLVIFVLLFRTPLAYLMGAGKSAALLSDTADYMAGFIIGAPATMGALILVPFLQMAGQSTLLVISVGVMTAADVILDLLNVKVFHGGMFGMGLASSLSYYAALLVAGIYFFSKKSYFKFSLKAVKRKMIGELFARGFPSVFNMAASVVRVFILNRILLRAGGPDAVAALSVITTIGGASNCITTGTGGVSLTLSGILFHEEDRNGLKILLQHLGGWAVALGALVTAFLFAFARPLIGLFIKPGEAAFSMGVTGLRIYAFGITFCCLVGVIKNAYQGVGRELLTELISVFEGVVFPVVCALIFSGLFGVTGIWFYYLLGEGTALGAILLYVRLLTRQDPLRDLHILMLPDSFSVAPEEMMETSVRTMEDVEKAAEDVQAFCLSRGQRMGFGMRIALCVEEMASNVIRYGFAKSKKKHHLLVRVMNKGDRWVIRFRDDCRAFDPISYVPKEGTGTMHGIPLVLKLADEVRYTYSMNLNNLMITLIDSRRLSAADGE